jgi:hypothetical protein
MEAFYSRAPVSAWRESSNDALSELTGKNEHRAWPCFSSKRYHIAAEDQVAGHLQICA